MLNFKKKVLFNIISRSDEDIIVDSINSILSQDGIKPFINVASLDCHDTTFYLAKQFCKNPSVYEPSVVISEDITVCRTTEEKTSITNGLIMGRKHDVQYYCFMHCPGILDKQYCKKLISQFNEDVICAYSNIMDSGLPVYTNLSVDKNINIGSYFIIKANLAERFNNNSMGDFLSAIVNLGVMVNVPEFLVESKWLESLSKHNLLMSKLA